jgi:hypothetical protein
MAKETQLQKALNSELGVDRFNNSCFAGYQYISTLPLHENGILW